MAHKRRRATHNLFDQLQQNLASPQRDLAGLVLVLLAVITLLSLFSITSGTLSDGLAALLKQWFGWGTVPLVVGIGWLGILMLLGRLRDVSAADSFPAGSSPRAPLRWDVIVGLELLFFDVLTWLHLLLGGADPLATARAGRAGGLVGWGISTLLVTTLGEWGTKGLLLFASLAVIGLLLRVSAAEASGWLRQVQLRTPSPAIARPTRQPTRRAAEKLTEATEKEEDASADVPPLAGRHADVSSRPRAIRSKIAPEIQALPLHSHADAAAQPTRRGQHLPPLDLLVPASKDPTAKADVRYQAQVIEETLQGFGVPARVREINVGPTVTQFGVEPGYVMRPGPDGVPQRQRVRVSRISALINDLALALSAAPIRIEAPVPGRPLVGIEVPNSKVSLVSLRGVLESDVYRKAKGHLRIPLGRDVSGEAVVADLAAMPHLLIAGATGSGKSVCVNAIITGLLCDHEPDELKLLMVDPKMVELIGYNGIPHLLAPVIVDLDEVPPALTWVTRLMEERYQQFAQVGARNIFDYNKRAARHRNQQLMPFVVIIIDELADLMMMAPEETERCVTRIAQMSRATGIHMVIATQRPSVDVVTGLIKANFPARLAFAVTSQIDSRVILDAPGAERLLGRGDCLLMLPDAPKLRRLQGCFVSDQEIRRVVDFWKKYAGEQPVSVSRPWDGMATESEQDALLEEAIDLALKAGRISTSFLQRHLGIGYPRAARLMDQLEQEGIICRSDDGRSTWVVAGSAGSDEGLDEAEVGAA